MDGFFGRFRFHFRCRVGFALDISCVIVAAAAACIADRRRSSRCRRRRLRRRCGGLLGDRCSGRPRSSRCRRSRCRRRLLRRCCGGLLRRDRRRGGCRGRSRPSPESLSPPPPPPLLQRITSISPLRPSLPAAVVKEGMLGVPAT